jgi:hypothetical protein
MSFKEITITTVEGNTLCLTAIRKVAYQAKYKPGSFLIIGKIRTKKVSVQYGIGVNGEGHTLKEAVADFRKNWTFSCSNRAAIMRSELSGWN